MMMVVQQKDLLYQRIDLQVLITAMVITVVVATTTTTTIIITDHPMKLQLQPRQLKIIIIIIINESLNYPQMMKILVAAAMLAKVIFLVVMIPLMMVHF